MGGEWVDRCPLCDTGFVEIGVQGSETPVEVLCSGPVKHFFPVLEKRPDPTAYRLGDQVENPTEFRLGDQVEPSTDV
jgi:hypothetical protein